MKKKLLSLLLVLSVLFSLTLPAAAQTTDDRLAAVTAKVKSALALDTTEYTEFYGDLMEDILAPSWYLEWFGENGTLTVSATEDGKILSYSYRDNSSYVSNGEFAPRFPAGDQDSAKKVAEEFMSKVLTRGESVTIEVRDEYLGQTNYRFSGEILLNGLSCGLSYSLSVRCEDNVITNFYRDDFNGSLMGGVPSAKAKITAETAAGALRGTLSLRPEYVLAEDGSNKAVLRYLPEYGDSYYVDAGSGELVNLTALAQTLLRGENGIFGDSASSSTPSATPSPEFSLTEAEKSGAEKLSGVMDKDALSGKVSAVSQLGLENYTLASVSYTVAREADESGETPVTAMLTYGRQVNGVSWRRNVTVDAKTGALIQVSSSAWMMDDSVARGVDAQQAQEKAEAFLQNQCGDLFAKTDLYNSSDALNSDRAVSHGFTFAQKENGYFFPNNSISIGVDATDGSISSYSCTFDESVVFDSAEGVLSMDAALDAWLNTYDVTLGYVQVPTAVDYSLPEYAPLKDYGISYLYRLVLGYTLEREAYLMGIDAKTGEPVVSPWADEDGGMIYSDVDGHWAQKEIEALARYSVGYMGGTFNPRQALTQRDLIALLASTQGYLYDGSEEMADGLYSFAYSLGILKKEQRSDATVMTRGETVRLMLDAMGSGPVAQLQGIFRTDFTDDSSIPADCYGYVALAQGLGMVSGNTSGAFAATEQTTRAQAAVMLYRLMAR